MKKTLALLCAVAAALILAYSCSEHTPRTQPVRHIILWTLDEDLSPAQKQELIQSTEADLNALEKEIPGVLSMKMYYEGRLESSNCDFMFDFRFESEEALKSFSENPAHLEVAAKLKPYISGRTCLDIRE